MNKMERELRRMFGESDIIYKAMRTSRGFKNRLKTSIPSTGRQTEIPNRICRLTPLVLIRT